MKFALAAMIALFGGSSASSLPPDPAAPPAEVRIGYLRLANGQLVSKALRLHEKALGVPVEWIPFDTGGQVNAAIAAGEIDFGAMGGPPAAAGVSAGIDYEGILLLNMLEGVEGLVVRSTGSSTTAAALVGKRIAVPFGSTSYYLLLTLLGQSDISQNEVTLLDMTPDQAVEAWTSGEIDGAYVWEPALHRMVSQGGTILIDNAEMARRGLPMWDIAVVAKSFSSRHADVVARYVQSECAAIDYWRAHPGEASSIIASELRVGSGDAARMMRGTSVIPCNRQLSPSYLGTPTHPGDMAKSLWPMAKFLHRQGRLKSVKSQQSYYNFVSSRFLGAERDGNGTQ